MKHPFYKYGRRQTHKHNQVPHHEYEKHFDKPHLPSPDTMLRLFSSAQERGQHTGLRTVTAPSLLKYVYLENQIYTESEL